MTRPRIEENTWRTVDKAWTRMSGSLNVKPVNDISSGFGGIDMTKNMEYRVFLYFMYTTLVQQGPGGATGERLCIPFALTLTLPMPF